MNLILTPDTVQLEKLKLWLELEYQNSEEGFYCNWPLINDSYLKARLILVEVDSEVIAFATWTNYRQ
ncbi:MAG: hypothetical protein BGO31_13110 [Bacteroidetes bacterium 43-16]|nr:MAG: hypothetical protein BGO31_13110 [Bacteroidetes bacterium 43-16]